MFDKEGPINFPVAYVKNEAILSTDEFWVELQYYDYRLIILDDLDFSLLPRTQLQNKKIATEKIQELVNKSLIVPKKRIATKPSRAKVEKRLESKKKLSEKKENRKFRF
jgi:hypothetical protein